MSLPKMIDEVLMFMSGAVSRIFGLNDDEYPNSGVQPFTGEPYDQKHDPDR